MNNSALYIEGYEVPIITDLAITTSYLIADIRDPSRRDSGYTKTIELPSTKETDEVFEFCFGVNIALQNFNPNVKKRVQYKVNNSVVLNGNLQLTKIIHNRDNGQITYVCNIKGILIDLFYEIGEKYLTGNSNPVNDLDFSDYDHTLNKTNVLNTWDPSVSPNTNKISGVDTPVVAGIGYRYPLIDYGLNLGDVRNYYYYHQRPVLFAYEYLIKIFANAGKSFTSTFLEGSFFKTLVIPTTEIVTVPSSYKDNSECYVSVATQNSFNQTLTYDAGTSMWQPGGSGFNTSVVLLDDNTTAPLKDLGGIYNTINGEFTITNPNTYDIKATIFFESSVSSSIPLTGVYVQDVFCLAVLEQFIGGSWVSIFDSDIYNTLGVSYPMVQSFDINKQIVCAGGEKFRIVLKYLIENVQLKDNTLAYVITGTTTYNFQDNVFGSYGGLFNSILRVTLATDNIYQDLTLEINKCIPKKIKQKDFVYGLMRMFNLYLMPDPTNLDNYLIEPRDTFYNSRANAIDWTSKLDIGVPMEILPMGELDAKRWTFNYTPDNADYYNSAYTQSWKETYGYEIVEVENDFVTNQNDQTIIFSPTPLVGNDVNGLIIPKIYKNNNGVVEHIKTNIRILQWGGSQSVGFSDYFMYEVDGSVINYSIYPYAGHLDNPRTPTIDLCFGVPREVYYKLSPYADTYTTNNLVQGYHINLLTQISDPDSKVVVANFNLDEIDINNLDFRNLIFFEGTYYYLNSVNDFNITNHQTTQVELLKLL